MIQDRARDHSEVIAPFFFDDPRADPADDIATAFQLDTVTPADIKQARREIRRVTQQSLRERQLPSRITVYRYGNLKRHAWSPDVTSVSLDPGIAALGGKTF